MKLPVGVLIDENLSPKLCKAFVSLASSCDHVRDVGLSRADDSDIWRFAVEHNLSIITKDADFHQRSLLYGHPPKVIWLRNPNSSTTELANVIAAHGEAITTFFSDEEAAYLVLL
ncbi:MAG: DUF5615 family PIN-like protein [Fimbriimonas sp.]